MTTAQGDPKAPLPWVIALHGLGDSPEGFRPIFVNLPRAAHVYLVQAPTPYGNGYDWFDGKTRADPEVLGQAIRNAAERIVGLARRLARAPENVGLPVVTGFSQGGYLSFALAALYPESFSAALPIAGSLPAPLWPQRERSGFRLIALHGVADLRVPLAPTRLLVERFKQQGYAATLLEYPGVAHAIPQTVFDDWQLALLEVFPQMAQPPRLP